MEDLAFVDTSIYTLHGDPIAKNSEEAPTISSKEGDNNDKNMYLGNKKMRNLLENIVWKIPPWS